MSIIARSRDIPISVIPEILLFFYSDKKIIRIVVSENSTKLGVEKFVKEMNLFIISNSIYVEELGNTWATIHNQKTQKKYKTNFLITIGKSEKETEKAHSLELTGETLKIGELLNYPACCVSAYPEISNYFDKWPLYYLSQDGQGRHSNFANRLAIARGGISPIGEMYPCSLECQNAISIGRKVYEIANKIGMKKLSEKILFYSKETISISDKGIVSLSRKSDNNKNTIYFS